MSTPSPRGLLVSCVIPLLFVACIEPRSGQLQPPGAGPLDDLVAHCPQAGQAPFAHVSEDVGAVAIGPCGHVAWVDSSDAAAPRVRLRGPDGAARGTYTEPSGYFGRLAFSPDGALFVYETLRSDLGFGDWTLIDLCARSAPAVAVSRLDGYGPFGFVSLPDGPGLWHCHAPFGAHEVSALELVSAARAETLSPAARCEDLVARPDLLVGAQGQPDAPNNLVVWDLAAGTARPLAELSPDWLHGDMTRWRDVFAVSASGRKVAIQRVAEIYIDTPHTPVDSTLPIAVHDATDELGPVAHLEGDLRTLVTSPRGDALIVADGAATSWYRDGVVGAAPDVTPLVAFNDGDVVLSRASDGALVALLLDSGELAPLAPPGSHFVVSADDALVAFASPPPPGADSGWSLTRWRPGVAAPVEPQTRVARQAELLWVSASGHLLLDIALAGDDGQGSAAPTLHPGVSLLDPAGISRFRAEGSARAHHELAHGLLVTTRLDVDRLALVDAATGASRLLVEGVDVRALAAPGGVHVAVTWAPEPGARRQLTAGAPQHR